MTSDTKVLMLGLDGAGADVVEALVAQGRMPNLGKMMATGTYGHLRSPARHYAGGVWPTFYTGTSVPDHGIYHNKLWRQERMRVEVPNGSWLTARPLWDRLDDAGLELCLIDVPMVLGKPMKLNGVHIAGWGTHDLICKGSWPENLWESLVRQHGQPKTSREAFGRQTEETLISLKTSLRAATDQLADIAIDLLSREPWNFGCIVFGALHRAGHYLWDQSQLNHDNSARSAVPHPDLIDLYEHVDRALGHILRTAPENILVIAFAAHGMGPNLGWSDIFAELFEQLEECQTGSKIKHGWLYRIKSRLPFHLVRPVLNRLPTEFTDRLVPLWSQGMLDWANTRYFTLPMDEAGYLRINLRGREARGVVSPGDEYNALCAKLVSLIESLRDEATGELIAGKVEHAYREAASDSRYRHLVPDLIVPWQESSTSQTRRVISSAVPGFSYDVPGQLPSGRSGNHTDQAWFVARGPDVVPARLNVQHSIEDLMPTVLEHFGIAAGAGVLGRAIALTQNR